MAACLPLLRLSRPFSAFHLRLRAPAEPVGHFLLPGDCPRAVAEVPGGFGGAPKRKWNAEKGQDKRSSGRHAAISETLSLLWVAHRNKCEEDVDVSIILEKDAAWTHSPSVQGPTATAWDGGG